MEKRGFTLVELLVVIVIVSILATLGSRVVRSARTNAKRAQAMVEMKSIETAIKAYRSKYGFLPAGELVVQGEEDITFTYPTDSGDAGDPDSEGIISILTNADDCDESYNQAGMVFLEPQGNGQTGAFLDPWGFQYRIALDTDYDGVLVVGGENVRRKVALAAVGLYAQGGDSSATNSLVKSWE
ncbi:type II secretion system protein [Pontiella sp.]|uniref:type II secretion system protein n=1 Tax=Pontiella sp. TaxID=2837462 RepID=UPI0035690E7D